MPAPPNIRRDVKRPTPASCSSTYARYSSLTGTTILARVSVYPSRDLAKSADSVPLSDRSRAHAKIFREDLHVSKIRIQHGFSIRAEYQPEYGTLVGRSTCDGGAVEIAVGSLEQGTCRCRAVSGVAAEGIQHGCDSRGGNSIERAAAAIATSDIGAIGNGDIGGFAA